MLNGAVGHAAGHSYLDLCVIPAQDRRSFRTDSHTGHRIAGGAAGDWSDALSTKTIVAGNGLFIERNGGSRGPGVPIVGHRLVAQGGDGDGVAGLAHPRSFAIAIDFADSGRGCGFGAVGMVVAFRESGGRHDGRVQVLSGARHKGQLIAELAVARVEQRIRGTPGAGVVHADDHHGGRIAGGVGRIDFPTGISHAVVGAPLVGIHAGDLGAGPIFEGYRQVGRRKLLTELGREGIEFGSEIVRDTAGEFGGDVGGSVDVELGDGGRLVAERHFLAVAEVASGTGEGRYLFGLREETDVVGHDALLADAGPNGLEREHGDGFGPGHGAQALGGILGVVGVVGGANRGLVGNDEHVA